MAELPVFSDGEHELARTLAADVAPLIAKHLTQPNRLCA
jgi:hypothetical protein